MKQAIDLDHGWWLPHNQLGMLALELADWKEAERAFRQARLLVSEETDEATVINNLAQLLRTTNRLGEAEPLMRRHLVIFLKFTRDTEHPHPHLRGAIGNYRKLLGAMALAEDELERRTVAVGAEAGFGEEDLRQLLDGL